MKTILITFVISGCYTINRVDKYADTKHFIVESDSVVYNGKVIYRVFKCINNCGYYDTFPNPAVNDAIKVYQKLMSLEQTASFSQVYNKAR